MKLKKLILILAAAMTVASCCLFRKVPKDNGNEGNSIMIGITMVLNERQMDSLITADELPFLDEWVKAGFIDYETNARIYKYTYIKELTETNEMIYVATPKDTLYKVIKRMIEIKEDE